ncbi:hypothetical protein FSP39_005104 [Pinctada imbricata]|uniref:FGGY carbohydrate kinase domain-containing protein n=1 Tax=Pinctada imbricata TaxID=66713 RepID=A0AA89BSM9_PINIB|nr:hypothetical protein FSP39_005104 [Pinctada imbricata]
MAHYIGIDVGTGSVRAALVTSKGKIVTTATQEIEVSSPLPDYYEQSSENIWKSVIDTVKTILHTSGISKDSIHGIGFDATCSLVVLDKDSNPVSVSPSGNSTYNVVMWMDHRAKDQASEINDTKHKALKSVGGKVSPEMEPPKLMWLKKNLAETCWKDSAHFIELPDFLTYKATGSLSRSLCSVVCKWLFQADGSGKKQWDENFMESIGLGDLLLHNASKIGSTVLPPGEPCGVGLSHQAAAELGLNPGTSVGTSIIDAHAGVLGCLGCVPDDASFILPGMNNRMVLICGTSSCHMIMSEKPVFVPGVWGPYYSAILPDMWGNEGGQSASGKLVDFVVDTHPACEEAKTQAAQRNNHLHLFLNEILEKEAKFKGINSTCKLTHNFHVWPDFHGNRSPVADPSLTGMKSGLTFACDIQNLALQYLATIQSIGYGTRHIIEENVRAGHCVKVIYMCGGLRKNPLFVQTHADVTGIPIILPNEEESVLLGAAVLGATASKDFTSIQDAMLSMCGKGKVIMPNTQNTEYHQKKYTVFLKMLDHQREYQQIMDS